MKCAPLFIHGTALGWAAKIGIVAATIGGGCAGDQRVGPATTRAGNGEVLVDVVATPAAGFMQSGGSGDDRTPTYTHDAFMNAGGRGAEVFDYKRLDGIVVWIGRPGRTLAPGTESATVEVGPSAAELTAVGAGTRVMFENRTGAPLTLYSYSDGNEFDLAPIPPGMVAAWGSDAPGLVEVFAEGRDEPAAIIYCAPGERAVVVRSGRQVRFGDLPPGEYQVGAWHERLPGSSERARVEAGETATAQVEVGVGRLHSASR